MNTSTSKSNALGQTLAAALVLSVVGFLLIGSRLTSSSAAWQERVFENKIPAHIPIKIKIKKEKEGSFKDLKNEKWLREFELELTNTGDKPIYYIEITMDTEVGWEGSGPSIVFPLRINLHECGFGPGPTPSPPPTPTPEPCQFCNDPNALRPADCSDPANPKCDPFSEYQQFGCC